MRRFFENKSKLHREAPHERPPRRRVFREIKLGWRAPLEPSDAGEPARKGPRSWRGGSGAAMGGESAKSSVYLLLRAWWGQPVSKICFASALTVRILHRMRAKV